MKAWRAVVFASLFDLALGLSLGLYYTITYYGRALLPLPGYVALGAPFAYYVAVVEDYSTVVQAWLWMLCFPLAGLLWRLGVAYVPGLVSAEYRAIRRPFGSVTARLGLSCWPLLLPIPTLAWHVGRPEGHWAWADFVSVCLRHRNVYTLPYLPAAMLICALAAFGLESRALWRLLPGSDHPWKVAVLILTVVIYVAAIVALGYGLNFAQPLILR
ncbi:MAG: hypothetical protein HPY69_07360 [Armatimonadetes bacterium]|nr:hypothetical protein [Armatimonadota bacterium]